VLVDDDPAFATIYCENCGAKGAPSLDHNEAAEAWNRRSDRAGHIAGLREAAGLARAHAAGCDNSGERVVCKLIEHDIRARITALEEEGKT
jgi:hypothetical protein